MNALDYGCRPVDRDGTMFYCSAHRSYGDTREGYCFDASAPSWHATRAWDGPIDSPFVRRALCELLASGRDARNETQPEPRTAGYVPPVPISVGHLGYSWTIEGGIVEVVTTGRSIIRAPLSTPIGADGSRTGREWWPDGELYRPQWYPLTFATIAEAEADRLGAGYAPMQRED